MQGNYLIFLNILFFLFLVINSVDRRHFRDMKYKINDRESGVQGFIDKSNDGKIILIHFDGSNEFNDVVTDLSIGMTKPFKKYVFTTNGYLPKVKVHKGVVRSINLVYERFLEPLLTLIDEEVELIKVSGYSLGGAFAQYFSMRLYNEFIILNRIKINYDLLIELITYGSFKVFTSTGVKWMKDRIPHERYVYGNDSVPLLPFLPWYKHTSKRIDAKGVKRKFPWIELFPFVMKHHSSCDINIDVNKVKRFKQ